MPDALSPDDVEKASFGTGENGYDKDEVDVFLRAVAAEMRSLESKLATASLAAERPYEALGRKMGQLLQHATDSALRVRKAADIEAKTLLQDAQRVTKKALEEAHELKRSSKSEASLVLEEAHAAADRIRAQVEQTRRLAEAEASLLRQDAHRAAKRIKDEAKQRAQETKAGAEFDAAERSKEVERRLRRLQELEVALQSRVVSLKKELESLTAEAEKRAPAPEPASDRGADAPGPAPEVGSVDREPIRLDAFEDETFSSDTPR